MAVVNSDALGQAFQAAAGLDAPLSARLDTYAAALDLHAPEYSKVVERLIARLKAVSAGEGSPKVGDPMPDFLLPDERGHLWSHGESLRHGPAVVAFHRGHWCPFCRINARGLTQIEEAVRARHGQIIAITPERGQYVMQHRSDAAARYVMLSDIEGGYALSLDLVLGYAGIVSLGHAAFFGLGAYGAALFAKHLNPDPLLGLAVATALAAAFGLQRGDEFVHVLTGSLVLRARLCFLAVQGRERGCNVGRRQRAVFLSGAVPLVQQAAQLVLHHFETGTLGACRRRGLPQRLVEAFPVFLPARHRGFGRREFCCGGLFSGACLLEARTHFGQRRLEAAPTRSWLGRAPQNPTCSAP